MAMEQKEKALDMALAGIEKQFGKGSVMKMGEKGSMAIGIVPVADRGRVHPGTGQLPRLRYSHHFTTPK